MTALLADSGECEIDAVHGGVAAAAHATAAPIRSSTQLRP
jgi:hypothetical protein